MNICSVRADNKRTILYAMYRMHIVCVCVCVCVKFKSSVILQLNFIVLQQIEWNEESPRTNETDRQHKKYEKRPRERVFGKVAGMWALVFYFN